jgi:hypothetical protein
MVKIVDTVRTVPGGVAVPAGTNVAIKKEVNGATVTTVTTDADGRFSYETDGHFGPYRYEVTSGGMTKVHSSKSQGYAGPISLGELHKYFRVWSDGVVQGVGSELAVTSAGTNMTLTVGQGDAIVKGLLYTMVSATQPVTLDAADPTFPRNDLIVVQVTRAGQTEEGKATLTKVTGTPATIPADPTATQTSAVWEYVLARVRVDAGATAIAAAGKITQLSTYAAPTIPTGYVTSAMILDGTIVNADINAAAAIAGTKIATNSITADQIAFGAVGQSELAASAVTGAHLDALAVTDAKIANATITGAKIATDTIGASNIAAGAIGASEIAVGAVGEEELADNAVTSTKIAAGAVGTTDLANAAVTTAKIDDDAVTMAKIDQAGATSGQLIRWNGSAWAPATVSTTIPAGSITTTEIANGTIVNADVSASAAIDGSKLAGLSVGSAQIAANAITSSELANSAVSNAHVAAGAAIDGSKIATGTISSTQIANGTIVNADVHSSAAIAQSKLDITNWSEGVWFDFASGTSVASGITTAVSVGSVTLSLPTGTWSVKTMGWVTGRNATAGAPMQVTMKIDGASGTARTSQSNEAEDRITVMATHANGSKTGAVDFELWVGNGGTGSVSTGPWTIIAFGVRTS